MKKRVLAAIAALMITTATVGIPLASADAVPTVTIGADLSEEQKETIYKFFNTDPSQVSVIEINHEQEKAALEGLVSNDIIGTRTLSCSYILPTNSGGLVVKTANLNWVTEGMIAQALLTSGVENCQVLATAPFQVSGTGALAGILTAYEQSTGEALDEEKKELANEELVLTAELTDELEATADSEETLDGVEPSTYVIKALNEMKEEALNGNLTDEQAKAIVDKYVQQYKLDLSEELYNKLVSYVKSFSAKDYAKSFKESLSSLTERINIGFDINVNIDANKMAEDTGNFFVKIWKAICNFFANLFGKGKEKIEETSENIFDNIDTSIFEFDTDRAEDEDEEVPVETSDEEVPVETSDVEVPVETVEDEISAETEIESETEIKFELETIAE